MRFQSGLTLIELVVAIALAAVIVALAAPSLMNLQARRAADAALSVFTDDLALARSEAIKRGNSVTICSSSDGSTCRGATEWREGWIVYVNAPAPRSAGAASDVLRVQGPVQGIGSMQATRKSLTFRPTGVGDAIAGHVQVTPQADTAQMRLLCVSALGRASLRPVGTSTC